VVRFAHNSERQFAKLLDFYNIAWEYEPRTFTLERDRDGKPAHRAFALASGCVAQRLDQLLGQLVRRVQEKFLARLVVLENRAPVHAGYLRRTRNAGLQHGLEVERGADGLAHFAQRLQLPHRLS